MKTKIITPYIAFIALSLFVFQSLRSQTSLVLIPAQSAVNISGTSSLHDWEEAVEKFDVVLNLTFREKEITGIEKVHFSAKSGSIVSDNNIMTNKTHDALKVEKFPEIVFRLVSVNHLSSQNGAFSGTLTGDISLAGVTKRITLGFTGMHSNNKVSIKGSKELKMSDFNIKPPTAMMGTLKTGESVTISFQLSFQAG